MTSLAFGKVIKKDCMLNLNWGHGGAAEMRDHINAQKIVGKNLFQGCGVGGSGDIKYQLWQSGFNGNWMASTNFTSNAGMNPIMSIKGQEYFDKYGKIKDKDQLYDAGDKYARIEHEWNESLAQKTRIDVDEIITFINSVGFMRLTQYHWASLIKEADDLINMKACQKVQIKFNCVSSVNSRGNKDLDQDNYLERLSTANADHLGKLDKSLLVDVNGNSIKFNEYSCGLSTNDTELKNIPKSCGETHVVDKEMINSYKQGDCGAFLDKVTTKYKKTRSLNGREDIFSVPAKEGNNLNPFIAVSK